jgi:hypothetical protein
VQEQIYSWISYYALVLGVSIIDTFMGSIPGAARFSEYLWVWNGVHSALVRVNKELLERKVAAPV